ncbi:lipase family protein [Marinospirillum perlucidum]|uniref:lipase family protein n=1 Tax=Marinospirillum perlucidum TaxID=1982602 RepID=UPI001C49A6C7|nr:lipase family protein [Marinospirillum perlucidum]
MRKFNHRAKGFSKINLSYLSHCSHLVYKSKQEIAQELEKLGFDLSRDRYFFSDPETDTQAFLVGDARKIILAFRGTEGKLADWATDARIFKRQWTQAQPLGAVHRGFYSALSSLWEALEEEVAHLRTNNQSLWITGHSLGGALASLAAATFELQHPQQGVNGVYTFGQPRIADQEFSQNYNKLLKERSFRCVNNNDVVTRVPPQIFGYSHVGKLLYFDADGELQRDNSLSWWARFWDRLEGRYDDVFNLTPDGVTDHSIEIYLNLAEKTHQGNS